jgi:hypothetical protein
MPIQVMMDRTGDSRHFFDANDARELAKAEQPVPRADERRLHRRGPDRFR